MYIYIYKHKNTYKKTPHTKPDQQTRPTKETYNQKRETENPLPFRIVNLGQKRPEKRPMEKTIKTDNHTTPSPLIIDSRFFVTLNSCESLSKETYKRDLQKRPTKKRGNEKRHPPLMIDSRFFVTLNSCDSLSKETYKRDLQKRPAKETYKRNLHRKLQIFSALQKRPAKETYKKRPTKETCK